MKERPYIGVTGAATTEEVRHLVSSFRANGISKETEHQPMVGILVSQKTLNGKKALNNRYPNFGDVAGLLAATETYSFNTIHYNSREVDDLSDQIRGIFAGEIYEDGLCRGLQLNIPWPPVEELVSVKRVLPDLKIIMQLSRKSLEGLTPEDTGRLMGKYGGLVDYALLDLSGGKGTVLHPQELAPYYLELSEEFPNLSVGFAGGFTGKNVAEQCRQIISLVDTNSFSIDAEGGLRNKVTSQHGDGIYNAEKVESYIQGAGKVLTTIF